MTLGTISQLEIVDRVERGDGRECGNGRRKGIQNGQR